MELSGNIVDVVARRIYEGTITVHNGIITSVAEGPATTSHYLLPGFIDAHVHIESSMLVPAQFARQAAVHGTVGTVSDPHEIANVLGIQGVEYMIENARQTPFRFCFGAPSCVPATAFESSGATITSGGIRQLLAMDDIGYLAEMMNFPGVINQDAEVMQKIEYARRAGMVIDGHAPGLGGRQLQQYAGAGITTDHECFSMDEALEKISLGMKILIRQGSAARNFDALIPLMGTHPQSVMLCCDDLHPHDLLRGHINLLVKRALDRGYNLFDVLGSVTINPKKHYSLGNGLLQKGDGADILVVDNLQQLNILQTYIRGTLAAHNGQPLLEATPGPQPNRFSCSPLSAAQLIVPALSPQIRVIGALDGELITRSLVLDAPILNDLVVADTSADILKIVCLNRYHNAPPAIAFIQGFGLKQGAIASTVAHDSHNILAVGTNDHDLARAINLIIQNRGGIAAVQGTQQIILPLPVAGIMTTATASHTASAWQQLEQAARHMGSTLRAPFMTLSFMALLVIPNLKLSDKGLFDGQNFKPVEMFV